MASVHSQKNPTVVKLFFSLALNKLIQLCNQVLLVLIVTSLISQDLISQVNMGRSNKSIEDLHIEVLEKDSVGVTFIYDLTEQDDCNDSELTYLGKVITKDQKEYKLLNSFWVRDGANTCRGISNLLVYNSDNVYVGRYHFNMPYELPDELVDNELVYYAGNKFCENKKEVRISFENGLPQTFYSCGGFLTFD